MSWQGRNFLDTMSMSPARSTVRSQLLHCCGGRGTKCRATAASCAWVRVGALRAGYATSGTGIGSLPTLRLSPYAPPMRCPVLQWRYRQKKVQKAGVARRAIGVGRGCYRRSHVRAAHPSQYTVCGGPHAMPVPDMASRARTTAAQ
eukprot:2309690-Rhodomonas_salina.1